MALEYLPLLMYALIIAIIIVAAVMGYMIYMKYKNRNLKSRNKKSPFAMAYADCLPEHTAKTLSSRRMRASKPKSSQNIKKIDDNSQLSNMASKRRKNSGVLEFYFEYEDENKI